MDNNNKSIFQLIEKLKEINVSQVFESTKSFSINDLRKISWSDIRKSKYLAPISGISISIILIFTILIPQFKNLRKLQSLSNRYSRESNHLPIIKEQIDKSLSIKTKLLPYYKNIMSLIPDNSEIVNLSALLTDAARRSLIEIQEFAPITKDELSSCTASSNDSEFEFEDNMNLDMNNFDDSLNDDFNENMDDFLDQTSIEGKFEEIELQKKLDYIVNNDELINKLRIDTTKLVKDNINENKYNMNYFKILVKADYINLLNFLRTIQEYKMIALPVCFEPKTPASGSASSLNQTTQSPGLVEARILINIPTLNLDTNYQNFTTNEISN